jgi:hypothetical protein
MNQGGLRACFENPGWVSRLQAAHGANRPKAARETRSGDPMMIFQTHSERKRWLVMRARLRRILCQEACTPRYTLGTR